MLTLVIRDDKSRSQIDCHYCVPFLFLLALEVGVREREGGTLESAVEDLADQVPEPQEGAALVEETPNL